MNYDERERQIIWFGMYNMVESALEGFGLAARLERGGVGAIIFGQTERSPEELLATADRVTRGILDQARLSLPCAIAVGIGSVVAGLSLAYRSFDLARQALRSRSQLGVEAIVTHVQSGLGERRWPLLLPAEEERLGISLEAGDSTREIKETLRCLYDPENPGIHLRDRQRELGLVLAGVLARIAHRNDLAVRDVLEEEDYALLLQGGPEGSPSVLVSWWESQFGQLGRAIRKRKNASLRTCIRQVQEFIEAHLAEEITLSRAARHVFMSPSYLSRLFREQTSEGFSEYVTRRKMEEARRLLEQGEVKIYEVAAAVGYADPAYFGRVFRRYFGMTPSEYRSRVSGA